MAELNNTKQQILKSALAAFIRFGYQGTSLADLCRITGLTKGAIYHHFQGKDDIYRQALDSFFQYPSLPNWLEEDFLSFGDRLRAGFSNIESSKEWIISRVGTGEDNAILQFYSFLYEATRRFPQYQKALDLYDDEKHRRLAKSIEKSQSKGEIRQDLNPLLLAIEIDALLQQLIYLRFVNPRIKANPKILLDIFDNYWIRLIPMAANSDQEAGS
jgi:AcrR family transcriptional regulator